MNCPHCDIPIDEHEANRCLDAWVAEVVLGWPVKIPVHHPEDDGAWQCIETGMKGRGVLWHFSIDIAAAWIVWNRCISQLFSERDRFFAVLEDDLTERDKEHERGWRIAWPHAMMNLSPLAICRAALKAVAVIQERKVMA